MDVAAFVEAAYDEARALLPAVPEGVAFDVDERAIVIPGWGVGGYALTGKRVLIGHDGSIRGEVLERRLRGIVFHECVHLAQGFTADVWLPGPIAALDYAVYEGCATVFERDRAGDEPPWSSYLDEATMLAWAHELADLPPSDDLERWLFWDPLTRRESMIYRTGVFIVDRVLERTGESIESILDWTPEQIHTAAGWR
jgi:hypothetical protein